MKRLPKQFILPLALIALGLGWLLNVLDLPLAVDWFWVCGLAIAGLLTILAGGPDKLTLVAGPFLLAGACTYILRKLGHLTLSQEVPILVVVLGVLLLLVNLFKLPDSPLLKESPPGNPPPPAP